MNWSALTKKQQNMVFATIALAVIQVLVLAYLLGWMSPSDSKGGSIKETLSELQEKLTDARAILARSEIIQKGLRESITELEALEQYTPNRSDRYAWAYEYVSLRATQAGVELDSLETLLFSANSKKKPEPLAPYEIVVSTQCGYTQLVEFIRRLEQGNELLRVKEVNVSLLPSNAEKQQVRIVLQWPASIQIERGSL